MNKNNNEYVFGEIYFVDIPFDENDGRSKKRPGLLMNYNSVIDQFQFYKITKQFGKKSKQIKAKYFELMDWEEEGLDTKSFIDTHRLYDIDEDSIISREPFGKISQKDKNNFVSFLKKKSNS